MRLSITALIRRFRRQRTFAVASLRDLLVQVAPPVKHLKIDDEEQQHLDIGVIRGHGGTRHAIMMLLLILLILGLFLMLLAGIIYSPPFFIIRFLQWRNPQALFHVPLPPSQRVVALTLDDAPSDQTPRILDLLKTYHARATFFIIGSQISAHADLIQRMHAEGHETGNHAWDDEPSFQLPISELERQVREVDRLLPLNANGNKYFRPGSGFFNAQMVRRITALGYKLVLGGVYPHDPQVHHPAVNAKHVLSKVRSGAIIIMHDRRSYSAEQLELVLKGLAKQKWRVESLGGLLGIASSEEARGKR